MKAFGLTLQDAGYMPKKDESQGCSPCKEASEPTKRYPTVYVDSKELPVIASKEATDDFVMVCLCHVTRRSESESEVDGKKQMSVDMTLEIRAAAIKPKGGKSAEEMTDAELKEGNQPAGDEDE